MTITDGHPTAEARKAQNRDSRESGGPIICTKCGEPVQWVPNDSGRTDACGNAPTGVYRCHDCKAHWNEAGLPALTKKEWVERP